MRNNVYEKDGEQVFAMDFTCEEIDYLDSKADAEARRTRKDGGPESQPQTGSAPAKSNSRSRKARAKPEGEALQG